MADYDNNMSGAIFKNDKKGNDKAPDYKGSAEINNQEFWVSSWIKTSKKGEKYMSLAFEAKDAQRGAAVNTGDFVPATANQQQSDDDIPF